MVNQFGCKPGVGEILLDFIGVFLVVYLFCGICLSECGASGRQKEKTTDRYVSSHRYPRGMEAAQQCFHATNLQQQGEVSLAVFVQELADVSDFYREIAYSVG